MSGGYLFNRFNIFIAGDTLFAVSLPSVGKEVGYELPWSI